MEQYVAMCDCPEIQELWEPKEGDRILHNSGPEGRTEQYLTKELAARIDGFHGLWLPRQEDWENILFTKHYAPAFPIVEHVVRAAIIQMYREFVDYMEAWEIEQPCEAWARLFMNIAHKKQWAGEKWG